MYQSFFYGPEETLNYQCGNLGNVKFVVSEPYTILLEQKPTLQTVELHGVTVLTSYTRMGFSGELILNVMLLKQP